MRKWAVDTQQAYNGTGPVVHEPDTDAMDTIQRITYRYQANYQRSVDPLTQILAKPAETILPTSHAHLVRTGAIRQRLFRIPKNT